LFQRYRRRGYSGIIEFIPKKSGVTYEMENNLFRKGAERYAKKITEDVIVLLVVGCKYDPCDSKTKEKMFAWV
jgi:hypothetical protein